MAPANHPTFHKDEKVFCFHHEILYEAKILELKLTDPDDKRSPYEYRVHYKGWKNTWDDWVLQDRLRKATDDNKELAATLRRDAEAASRARANKASGKRRTMGSAELGSSRGSEERHSSVPARGTKRGRDNDIEKDDQFYSRPSMRIVIPDNLKSLLVDDWEYVTRNVQLVPLPSQIPVNKILELYTEEEKKKRSDSAEVDVLEEVVFGIREYFDKALSRILLYRFEREQYNMLRRRWDSRAPGYEDKGPCDVYGAEHLARMFAVLPELLAQTNLSQQATNRLREELSKFTMWLSKNSEAFFSAKYKTPDTEYAAKAKGMANSNAPGTATSHLF
ncbi:hypothetical protein AJ80_00981 [Polytolypa hystricis UAMH7299]|uniref:Chromatin modification-related protein EAF3 n=1 Tax=Polytolypa hystricis (strain UAMH7299) TaxID=1447883 RepID=A0A2B7Z1S2_POLH7|nr:hypothetical protein AJ80_00981 [Polytolypa hystricis UAMH7299]